MKLVSKKTTFGLSEYNKPLPKKILKLAIAMRASILSLGVGSAFAGYPHVSIGILISGAFIDGIISFFSEETKIL